MGKFLISFDIDGTIEAGNPPGPITMDMVRRVKQAGHFVGSGSGNDASSQQSIWAANNIQVDFIVTKDMLGTLKERFQADRYLHIGDMELDRQMAEQAGFEFLWAQEAVDEPWLAWF